MEEIKGAKAIYGDSKHLSNYLYFLDYKLDYFTVRAGPSYDNIFKDVSFRLSFNFRKDDLHIGEYINDCECAFLYKASFNGDDERNIFKFLQTKSLNKIKSNKRAKNIQFVAVGTDGLILLIDRQLTSVEDDQKQELTIDKNANFTIYPNPVGKEKEIVVESKEIINTITITDISGKQSMNIHQVGKMSYRVPISNIASGVYFITVNGVSKQFVVE